MITTLPFYKAQTEEGIEWEVYDSRTGADENLSSVTEINLYVYSKDGTTLLFTGSKTGGEITVSGTGNNIVKFLPDAPDMNIAVGTYKGELKITYSTGRIGKIQDLLVKIKDDAPTA